MEGTPILLIDGGNQKRCFTDVTDGVECLYRIIENKNGVCDGKIINIGNPDNEISIKGLAELLLTKFEQHPLWAEFPPFAGFRAVESGSCYGSGYQDVQHRKPSIRNAKKLLGWTPTVGIEKSVERTLDFFLTENIKSKELLRQAYSAEAAVKAGLESRPSVPYHVVPVSYGNDRKSLELKAHENRSED